jgi:hypothetical protein
MNVILAVVTCARVGRGPLHGKTDVVETLRSTLKSHPKEGAKLPSSGALAKDNSEEGANIITGKVRG